MVKMDKLTQTCLPLGDSVVATTITNILNKLSIVEQYCLFSVKNKSLITKLYMMKFLIRQSSRKSYNYNQES